MKRLIFLGLSLVIISCSGESRWSATELYLMAYEEDKTVEQVPIPQTEAYRRVLCRNYGEGCVPGSGKRVRIKGVEIAVLEFEKTEFAKKEAYRLNQYYARNWLFDEVTGETPVIKFLEKVFGAKNPHHKKRNAN